METNENTTTPDDRAASLLIESLESFGESAMALGEQARALVGVAGIERIARDMIGEGSGPENGHAILGALRALLGSHDVESSNEDWQAGFAFVNDAGFNGRWS